MAMLFYPLLSSLLLLAVADFNFGEAAQNMIDKIQSGDKSLPVLKEISARVKANMLQPPARFSMNSVLMDKSF
eukprot:Skav227236  [mRNA]  locus=scaffold2789:90976:91639:- [translate_table: standard]